MAELTVRQLRAVIQVKLGEARTQVKKWQEYLSLLDDLERESGGDAVVSKTVDDASPQKARNVEGKDTGGRLTRELMLRADGSFTVLDIVKQVNPQYPSVSHETLARRGAAIAYRLVKAKKIEVVKRGRGRQPSKYRVRKRTPEGGG